MPNIPQWILVDNNPTVIETCKTLITSISSICGVTVTVGGVSPCPSDPKLAYIEIEGDFPGVK